MASCHSPFRGGFGLGLIGALLVAGCGDQPWNSPYPDAGPDDNTLYVSFSERPKHLDPARSYSSNEVVFTGQIYEPPLQYHYLRRPYELIPATLTALPEVEPLDAARRPLAPGSRQAPAYTRYTLRLRPGIRYQPHPALARDASGAPRYHALTADDLDGVHVLGDFPHTGTRELVAEDYAYQIKRLAHPQVHSPIYGLMAEYIVGLEDLARRLKQGAGGEGWLDLRTQALDGVEVVDRHTLRITLKGSYPQFAYWLAMPFFAPIPWEADRFYSQPGLAARNITLDWYPIGTGPYLLAVNNPNRQMVLERNPEFRGEPYPSDGAPGDRERGLLASAGQTLPFIDRVVYSLEKEDIPYWTKFLQGYYDLSGITSDSFDQAIRVGTQGDMQVSDAMSARGIRLSTAVAASTFYLGFNMLDPVIGGLGERSRRLRQALTIALDYEEYIAIFLNGRGIAAQGPIPPGIRGYREGAAGLNPVAYVWEAGAPQRRALAEAEALLAAAGYPGGIDPQTRKPLVLYFDVTGSGPDDKARLDWFRKQFQKLGIDLVIRATDYNRFQEKMRKGDAQIFIWGWNADYPDPENFLFLLHGAQGKVQHGGENAANYANPEYDRLFERMKNMPDGAERDALIDRMVAIARVDAPWVWGLHPKQVSLRHAWFGNDKPNLMANNTLKYLRLDPALRAAHRAEWNRPLAWPLLLAALLAGAALVPGWRVYRRRQSRQLAG